MCCPSKVHAPKLAHTCKAVCAVREACAVPQALLTQVQLLTCLGGENLALQAHTRYCNLRTSLMTIQHHQGLTVYVSDCRVQLCMGAHIAMYLAAAVVLDIGLYGH